MKRYLIIVLLLLSGTIYSQQKWGVVDDADYIYVDFSIDPNQLLIIKDNPRTQKEVRGFDWDFEIGAREDNFNVYMFYGQFDEINYKNYGAGVDYHIRKNPQKLDLSVGLYYSQILRKDIDGNYFSFTAWVSPRARATYWLGDFGLNIIIKGQARHDISERVWELAGGLTFKLDR